MYSGKLNLDVYKNEMSGVTTRMVIGLKNQYARLTNDFGIFYKSLESHRIALKKRYFKKNVLDLWECLDM